VYFNYEATSNSCATAKCFYYEKAEYKLNWTELNWIDSSLAYASYYRNSPAPLKQLQLIIYTFHAKLTTICQLCYIKIC